MGKLIKNFTKVDPKFTVNNRFYSQQLILTANVINILPSEIWNLQSTGDFSSQKFILQLNSLFYSQSDKNFTKWDQKFTVNSWFYSQQLILQSTVDFTVKVIKILPSEIRSSSWGTWGISCPWRSWAIPSRDVRMERIWKRNKFKNQKNDEKLQKHEF